MACCIRQYATTEANVDPDLCHHMALSSHDGLITFVAISLELIPDGLTDNKLEQALKIL